MRSASNCGTAGWKWRTFPNRFICANAHLPIFPAPVAIWGRAGDTNQISLQKSERSSQKSERFGKTRENDTKPAHDHLPSWPWTTNECRKLIGQRLRRAVGRSGDDWPRRPRPRSATFLKRSGKVRRAIFCRSPATAARDIECRCCCCPRRLNSNKNWRRYCRPATAAKTLTNSLVYGHDGSETYEDIASGLPGKIFILL